VSQLEGTRRSSLQQELGPCSRESAKFIEYNEIGLIEKYLSDLGRRQRMKGKGNIFLFQYYNFSNKKKQSKPEMSFCYSRNGAESCRIYMANFNA
jgi:hypothetical protein